MVNRKTNISKKNIIEFLTFARKKNYIRNFDENKWKNIDNHRLETELKNTIFSALSTHFEKIKQEYIKFEKIENENIKFKRTKVTIPLQIFEKLRCIIKSKLVIILGFLLFGSYITWKFFSYQKLGYVYALTDSIRMRSYPYEDSSNIKYTMDLSADELHGSKSSHFTRMHLTQTNEINGYYKTRIKFSLWDYIFKTTDSDYYVSIEFTTKYKENYENIRFIFSNLIQENKLYHLNYSVRNVLVSALRSNPKYKDLRISKPCNLVSNGQQNIDFYGIFKKKDSLQENKILLSLENTNNCKYYVFVIGFGNANEYANISLVKFDSNNTDSSNSNGCFSFSNDRMNYYSSSGVNYVSSYPFTNFLQVNPGKLPLNLSDRNFNVSELIRSGIIKAQKNELDSAIYLYKQAILKDSANPKIYSLLAYVYYKKGDYVDALEFSQSSIKCNPFYVRAHYNMALIYWKLNQKENALNEVEKTIKIQKATKNEFRSDLQFFEFRNSERFKALIQ